MSDDAVGGARREGDAAIDLTDVQVQVVRGAPDDLELAALVAGLVAAAGGQPDEPDPTPTSAWTDRSRPLRTGWVDQSSPTPSPDAWRWSLRG